jgi:hypothetical protein
MMAEDLNDILRREGSGAIRAMFDEAAVRHRLNGSAPKEEEREPPPCKAEKLDEPKNEPPEGFIPYAQIRPVAPIELVKGIAPRKGTSLLVGQSSTGKSFIATDLSISIATGAQFFGRQVKRRGGVVYIALEGGDTFGNRVTAAAEHRGIKKEIPFNYSTTQRDLSNDGELERLIKELKQIDAHFQRKFGIPLCLVIIDTMSVAFSLENENDNAQVAAICKRLQRIEAETGAHVMGIHHAGKNQDAGARGASAWRANVDNVLSCAADRNEVTGECKNRRLSVSKYRDGIEGPMSGYELKRVTLGENEDGEPFGSCAIVATDIQGCGPTKTGKVSADERLFDAAFNEAAIASGREIRVHGDGPIVKAVPMKRVREEFYKRRGTGEDDKAKRQEASKKAFQRVLPKISWRYAADASGEEELVWKL